MEFHCPIICNNDYNVVYYNHPLPLQKKKHQNEDGTIRSEWQNGIYRKWLGKEYYLPTIVF